MAARLFGTNGIRGVVNQEMNASFALDVGCAIGSHMGGKVAVATDCRTSADMIKSAVAAGLMASGASVLDLGMLPTPALQYYVKNSGVKGGVMITASHNPPEFNGIKCIDYDGTEMPREKEERIEAIYFSKSFVHKNWKSVGSVRPVEGVGRAYNAAIRQHVDVDAIARAKLNVVLDCANGAATATSPDLLADLGVRVVSLNSNPQGTFPGHPSEPTAENLKDLMATVKATGADLGIAHDGDADRSIFVDDKGNFIFGDRSLAIVARHIVRQNGGGVVVTPVSSSSCVEDVVKAEGGEVVYTRVGSPVVARKMIENGAIFGGEENGGLIFPQHQYCRDGGMTAAKMLEIVSTEGPMSKLLSTIPEYFLDKRKMECPEDRKEEILALVVEQFSGEKVDTTDGVKVFFSDGWTLIRPSGTEPIFRMFSEAKSVEDAKRCGDRCEKTLREILK